MCGAKIYRVVVHMHFEGVRHWLVGVATYPRKRSLANSKITEGVEPVRFAHERPNVIPHTSTDDNERNHTQSPSTNGTSFLKLLLA